MHAFVSNSYRGCEILFFQITIRPSSQSLNGIHRLLNTTQTICPLLRFSREFLVLLQCMKPTLLLILAIQLALPSLAQPWLKNLPPGKSQTELNFYDYKNAILGALSCRKRNVYRKRANRQSARVETIQALGIHDGIPHR